MLAAFASAVTNTSGAGGNYAAIYVEQAVVRWLMELIGFPRDGSDGVLLGGGSDANRHCLEVARYWGAQVNGWDIRDEGLHGHPQLTMYMSAEGHSCLEKAAFTLGLGAPARSGRATTSGWTWLTCARRLPPTAGRVTVPSWSRRTPGA